MASGLDQQRSLMNDIRAKDQQDAQMRDQIMRGYGARQSSSYDYPVNRYSMFGSPISDAQTWDAFNTQNALNANPGVDADYRYAQQNRTYGLEQTEGAADAIMGDPRYRAALDAFGSVVSGQNLPLGQATQNRIYGQAADSNAAANTAQDQMMQRQLAASGGSIYDPSYQAAQRENMSQRQVANQGTLRDIKIKAALENFTAQQGAARSLAATRGQQYSLSNPLRSQAAGYYMGSYNAPQGEQVQQVSQPQQPQWKPDPNAPKAGFQPARSRY